MAFAGGQTVSKVQLGPVKAQLACAFGPAALAIVL